MAKVASVRVLVATIGKPFGVKGAITVRSHSDELESRLLPGEVAYFSETTTEPETVVSARFSAGGGVVALAGVCSREGAETLRGRELWIEISQVQRPSSPDEWYTRQLVGLSCRAPDGSALGEVVAVQAQPAHDTLIVRWRDIDIMVPFVHAIVPDVDDSGVVIDDPGGLFPSDETPLSP
jgi:16S rRNA processing protein RimM